MAQWVKVSSLNHVCLMEPQVKERITPERFPLSSRHACCAMHVSINIHAEKKYKIKPHKNKYFFHILSYKSALPLHPSHIL